MITKKYCFAFKSYYEAKETIKFCKEKKIIPVLYLNYHLLNGLGVDWFVELKNLLYKEFNLIDFELYADVRSNYGLFIALVEKNINYLNVKANQKMIKKLYEIAKINKVLINPNFSVVKLSKIKREYYKTK